jgi:DNA-binding CsgD family transcriptional regulator
VPGKGGAIRSTDEDVLAEDALAVGRRAFAGRQWETAYAKLSEAERQSWLAPEDLELLVSAAYLTGREEAGNDLSVRAFELWLQRDDAPHAARRAFWLGLLLLLRGEGVRADAWFSRARSVLDAHDCVERGYLLIPIGLGQLDRGDFAAALETFHAARDLGAAFEDRDLAAIGALGTGQALVGQGEVTSGLSSLDEAMVAITADEVSPIAAGIVYCAVIDTCQAALDLRRAQQWTVALSHWCNGQPDLVPYRGQCLVHRAEIMTLHGGWNDALEEARRACDRLAGHPAAGEAFYQLAEVHRLRGNHRQAEDAYRQASRWIPNPQPGLALLWLASGRLDAAAAAIHRALGETIRPATRAKLLAAAVEIAIAAGDLAAARPAADELRRIADQLGTPLARAMNLHAQGSTLVAENDAAAALTVLRQAWAAWQSVDVPYESARVRVQMGLACQALGDLDSAEMEFDAARWIFEQLGAGHEVDRTVDPTGSAAGPLTPREREVLQLVATGRTNRAIAADLFLSEKTVARHLSNIFTKLGVTSRTAASAYAYRHGLA